jgi:hypothetical protein
MSVQFRELKARKAKFGFDGSSLPMRNGAEFNKFFESLHTLYSDRFTINLSNYNNPEVRIYTDDTNVAEWIRNYKL